MNNKLLLFFDIETTANQEAIDFMPEPSAPANYKDPEKIAAYIEEKKKERVAQAALDADLGQITAISVRRGVYGDIESNLVGDEKTIDEKALIDWFWGEYWHSQGNSCGYNIIGFDLPFILRRSFDLGVSASIRPNLAKYQIGPTTDLMGILYNWGPAKGLKFVCKRYGINNPLPDLNGSQVAIMDNDTLRKYVSNDVYLVTELYKRMYSVYLKPRPLGSGSDVGLAFSETSSIIPGGGWG